MKIDNLSAEGFGVVDCFARERDFTKKILPPFLERNGHVHLISFIMKGVTRFIALGVKKPFRDVKPMHQLSSFLDIGRDKVVGWIAKTAERLTARAHDDGNSPKDYSCTLIAAIVGNDAAAFAQIADGAIVVSHGEADGWSWVFWPQHGEFANQTNFITQDNALEVLEFELARSFYLWRR